MELSTIECTAIAKKAFKRDDVTVVSFEISGASDAARGFISTSKLLRVHVKVEDQMHNLTCFVKFPPGNPFHSEMVRQTRAFYKESQFFSKLYPLLEKYLPGKVFPECYFSNDHVTVLEDLTSSGYTNAASGALDRRHVEAALASLAAFHASSFAAEISNKSRFDQICPEILFISWFSHLPDHPGRLHLQTGVKALQAVFEQHFTRETPEIRRKAVDLLGNVPNLLLPSAHYRNCLSHNDLWTNNIMFKYADSKSSKIQNACLIDLQLFGYNPPAHDVYTLILLNSIDEKSKTTINALVEFYYDKFSNSLKNLGLNPADVLSFDDFKKSESESIPLALGSAVLFTHFTTIPEQYLSEIIHDRDALSKMMHQDRTELVLKCINTVPEYKTRLFAMINNLMEYLKGEWDSHVVPTPLLPVPLSC